MIIQQKTSTQFSLAQLSNWSLQKLKNCQFQVCQIGKLRTDFSARWLVRKSFFFLTLNVFSVFVKGMLMKILFFFFTSPSEKVFVWNGGGVPISPLVLSARLGPSFFPPFHINQAPVKRKPRLKLQAWPPVAFLYKYIRTAIIRAAKWYSTDVVVAQFHLPLSLSSLFSIPLLHLITIWCACCDVVSNFTLTEEQREATEVGDIFLLPTAATVTKEIEKKKKRGRRQEEQGETFIWEKQ